MNRGKLDDTLAAMFSNQNYRTDYLFYAHMIGQCSIKILEDLPAPAAIMFNINHYDLLINPYDKWVPYDTVKFSDESKVKPESVKVENGIKMFRERIGFDGFSLVERLAILKHEMEHIMFDHIFRGKEIENLHHYIWNLATDCANNQMINPDHLPDCAVVPKNLGEMFGIEIPKNLSAEQYYEILLKAAKDKKKGNGDGEGGDENQGGMDNHDVWEQSVGDRDLQKDITKKMLEKAQDETLKDTNPGKVPGGCSEAIAIFSRKAELDWKKVLRGIVGNKKANRRNTITRRDRRLPTREDLRGKVKDRTFNLLVVGDVSGSRDNDSINKTLSEVRHICDVTKSNVNLIQIDTKAYEPEKLTKSTKVFTRKGCGGTSLFGAIEKAKEHKLDFQAVVVLTDGYLFDNEVNQFKSIRKKVIWLVDGDGQIMNGMNDGLMKAFKLTDK